MPKTKHRKVKFVRKSQKTILLGKLGHLEAVNEILNEQLAEAKKRIDQLTPSQNLEKIPCLEEAQKIVYGRGEKEYGHPAENFKHTARLFNAQFHDKLSQPFTPQDVAYALILVKLSRQNHMEKRDNIVDICGYAETAQRVIDKVDAEGLEDEFLER